MSSTLIDAAERELAVYYDRSRPDPFVSPLIEKKRGGVINGLDGVQSVDDIQVQGFVYDEDAGSYVVANGVVLMEGQQQSGVRVLSIDPSGVVFSINGEVERKAFETEDSNQ